MSVSNRLLAIKAFHTSLNIFSNNIFKSFLTVSYSESLPFLIWCSKLFFQADFKILSLVLLKNCSIPENCKFLYSIFL